MSGGLKRAAGAASGAAASAKGFLVSRGGGGGTAKPQEREDASDVSGPLDTNDDGAQEI